MSTHSLRVVRIGDTVHLRASRDVAGITLQGSGHIDVWNEPTSLAAGRTVHVANLVPMTLGDDSADTSLIVEYDGPKCRDRVRWRLS